MLIRMVRGGALGVAALAAVLAAGCGAPPSPARQAKFSEAAVVSIAPNADQFSPYILMVTPGTMVHWRNDDTLAHTVVTTPQQTSYLNPQTFALRIAPGQTGMVVFTTPGLYHYYDTGVAAWDTQWDRVEPMPTAPRYPEAMDGVIWVRGSVPNLPTQAANSVPYLHDMIAQEFVAIRTGGTVAWSNHDTEVHFFLPVLGWDAPINPVDFGLNDLQGSDTVPPNGQTQTLIFATPGLYYYYGFMRASVDPVQLRAYALTDASEYPISMDGFVLVSD